MHLGQRLESSFSVLKIIVSMAGIPQRRLIYQSSAISSHNQIKKHCMIRRLKIPTLLKSCLPRFSHFSALVPLSLTSLSNSGNLAAFKNTFAASTFQHQNLPRSNYQGKGFYVQQMFTGCLVIYSYYIESGNDCFLIDPLLEVSVYNDLIKKRGKTLKGIFVSHYHADYVSGQYHLQKMHNCKIYMGPNSIATDTVVSMKDKERIKVGDIELECWHTPGHTEESSCLVLINTEGKRDTIFTGDTIFLNEVGRPDLAVKNNLSAADLAGMLFDSLQKLKTLNDDIRIYPGHGSGSSCGKSIGKGDFCDMQTQKKNNYGLKTTSKAEFIESVLKDMPKPPQYFGYDAKINKFEPLFYQKAKQAHPQLTPTQVKELSKNKDTFIIDIRDTEQVQKGVIAGCLCIAYNGGFANWVGTLLKPTSKLILYGGNEQQALQTIRRLHRIGYVNIIGHATFPISDWKAQGYQVFVPEFYNELIQPQTTILDVRKPMEWHDNGVVEGSVRIQLNDLYNNPDKLDKSKTYIIHCALGYRARIAWSFLTTLGYKVKAYPYPFPTIFESGKAKKVAL